VKLLLLAAVALATSTSPPHPGDAWQLSVHETLVEHLDRLLACRPPLPEHLVPAWVHLTVGVGAEGLVQAVDLAPQYAPPGPKLRRCLERTVRSITFPTPPAPSSFVRTLFLEDGLAEDGRPGVQRLRLPLLVGGAPMDTVVGLELEAMRGLPDGDQRTTTAFVLNADQVMDDLRRRLWLQRIWDQLEEADLPTCGADDARIRLEVDANGTAGPPQIRGGSRDTAACLKSGLNISAGPAPDGEPTSVSASLHEGTVRRALWPDGGPVPLLSAPDNAMVDAVRARAERGVQVCYSEALDEPQGRVLAGTLSMGLVIGSVGEVLSVHTGGELRQHSLASCVVAVHERLEFPAPVDGGVVVLSIDYAFSPR
jgi:hypothetical protein